MNGVNKVVQKIRVHKLSSNKSKAKPLMLAFIPVALHLLARSYPWRSLLFLTPYIKYTASPTTSHIKNLSQFDTPDSHSR